MGKLRKCAIGIHPQAFLFNAASNLPECGRCAGMLDLFQYSC